MDVLTRASSLSVDGDSNGALATGEHEDLAAAERHCLRSAERVPPLRLRNQQRRWRDQHGYHWLECLCAAVGSSNRVSGLHYAAKTWTIDVCKLRQREKVRAVLSIDEGQRVGGGLRREEKGY